MSLASGAVTKVHSQLLIECYLQQEQTWATRNRNDPKSDELSKTSKIERFEMLKAADTNS